LAKPQHILITGASSGLGAGLARSYAALGIRLSLVGRNEDRLRAVTELCRKAGAMVESRALDVADADGIAVFVLEQDDKQPIDLILANAGTSAGAGPDGTPEGVALASRQIRTNLLGVVQTIEPLLPRFLARRAGHVAVVSSVAGYRGLPYSPAYSASKAGVRAYGDALGALLGPQGIAVSVIVPGFFDTPMTDRFQGAKPLLRSLPCMVAAIRKGLDKRRRRIVCPRLLGVGLQLADLIPARLGDMILRRARFHIQPGV
jgi:short-subunit dehydrogenase